MLTMIRANDAEDAVNIANGTEFGLGNSIFGSNFNQVNQIADQLQSGNVAINDFATFTLRSCHLVVSSNRVMENLVEKKDLLGCVMPSL